MKFIYLVSDSTALKVGIASNVKSRISSMQTSNPRKIRELYSAKVDCENLVEKRIHNLLKRWNIRGEWFSCDPIYAYNIVFMCCKSPSLSDIEIQKMALFRCEDKGVNLSKSEYRVKSMSKPKKNIGKKARRKRRKKKERNLYSYSPVNTEYRDNC